MYYEGNIWELWKTNTGEAINISDRTAGQSISLWRDNTLKLEHKGREKLTRARMRDHSRKTGLHKQRSWGRKGLDTTVVWCGWIKVNKEQVMQRTLVRHMGPEAWPGFHSKEGMIWPNLHFVIITSPSVWEKIWKAEAVPVVLSKRVGFRGSEYGSHIKKH